MTEVRQPLWLPQWLLRCSGSRLWLSDAVRMMTRFGVEMVALSLEPGVRVRDLARQHGICASLIYRWRREQAEAGPVPEARLLPVQIVSQEVAPRNPPLAPLPARPSGSIEIELDGGVGVRVGDDVSLVALRRVMAALRG